MTRLALFALALSAGAQESTGVTRTVTVRDGETVRLQLRVSDAGANVLTAVTFPDTVAHVVSSWNPKDLSVEHETTKLFLKLFSKVEGYIDVVTAAGTHYRLYVVPAAATAPVDSHVVVNRAEPPSEQRTRRTFAGPGTGPLELMRAMRLGQVPADATVQAGKKEESLFSGEDLEASLLWLYETGRYRGYVLALANRSADEAAYLDVSRFQAEDLVLVGARDVLLSPRGSTRLYLVFWK